MKKIIMMSLGLLLNSAFAQISFDRTRVIVDSSQKNSQTIVISNNSETPFLAQAWIENSDGQKITSPLAALPILQRINSGQNKQLKLNIMGDVSELPSDRETMLFLNVLGVPPKNASAGAQVNIVVQSKMKLFYRPKGLPSYGNNGWVEEVVARRSNGSLMLENPTPYHVIVYAFVNSNGRSIERDVVLQPFSNEVVNINTGHNFSMLVINDQGSSTRVNYNCSSDHCTGIIQKK